MNAKRPLSAKPLVDALEDRCVPTTVTLSNGILRVVGTDASEAIRLTQTTKLIRVEGVADTPAGKVRGIAVDARGGDDTIDMRSVQVGAAVGGGAGNDVVFGTQAADVIFGDGGNDLLFGG